MENHSTQTFSISLYTIEKSIQVDFLSNLLPESKNADHILKELVSKSVQTISFDSISLPTQTHASLFLMKDVQIGTSLSTQNIDCQTLPLSFTPNPTLIEDVLVVINRCKNLLENIKIEQSGLSLRDISDESDNSIVPGEQTVNSNLVKDCYSKDWALLIINFVVFVLVFNFVGPLFISNPI